MHSQLAPGVTRIATSKRDNAFLIDGDDGFTLVDVGWSKAPRILLNAVADLGRKPSDIRRVVLTHAHPDHVQGAAELRRHTGAQILIHAADRAWLEAGRVPAEGRSGAVGRLIDRLPKLHWSPTDPDGTVADRDVVEGSGGLRVVHTPATPPGTSSSSTNPAARCSWATRRSTAARSHWARRLWPQTRICGPAASPASHRT